MTRTQAIGIMLIALGLAYAVGYAGWVRRQRRHRSAGAAVAADGGSTGAGQLVSAMGDYEGTARDGSGEKVTTAGLGAKGPATLLVRRGDPEHLVTLERRDHDDLVVTAERLVGARRDSGPGRRLPRRGAPALLLTWRGEVDGPAFTTTFRPRFEEDLDKVESALWWHSGGHDLRAGRQDPAADEPDPDGTSDAPPGDDTDEGSTTSTSTTRDTVQEDTAS